MEKRSYIEICNDLKYETDAKKIRKLHKELKAYGSGALFLDRYPYFPLFVSIIIKVICFIATIATLLTVCNK